MPSIRPHYTYVSNYVSIHGYFSQPKGVREQNILGNTSPDQAGAALQTHIKRHGSFFGPSLGHLVPWPHPIPRYISRRKTYRPLTFVRAVSRAETALPVHLLYSTSQALYTQTTSPPRLFHTGLQSSGMKSICVMQNRVLQKNPRR
jgi:hypothetical protein